jgi:acylphosphatase
MSEERNVRLEAIASGLVQGVYFRYFTQQEAIRLGLKGWVANQPDGRVKVVAEGDEATLQQLLEFLHQGSPASRVETVEANWLPASGTFMEFKVRRL